MKADNKKFLGLLRQTILLFAAGVILIGIMASFSVYQYSLRYVMEQMMDLSISAGRDTRSYICQFPSHDWLIRYWYENSRGMDVEYDADYGPGTKTEQKCRLLEEHQPQLQLMYAGTKEIEALPEEDQKLYAEIVYSWTITRIGQIARNYEFSYLFGIVSEEPYEQQFWLFNASKIGGLSGNKFGEIFELGMNLTTTEKQRKAMRSAASGTPSYAVNQDGKYADYYYPLTSFDGHDVLIGLTRYYQTVHERVLHRIYDLGLLLLLIMCALAGFYLLMIRRTVLDPMKMIQKNIRQYKETKDSSVIVKNLSRLRSQNELKLLGEDVTALAEEMSRHTERIEKITAERERIETELNLAGRIQTSMLPGGFPAFPERNDFDIYGSMDPAKEVGGDFYDFFLVDDRHLCMIIADVSGKGIPAALFMMASRITLSHNIRMGKSPSQILADTNEAICSRNPEEMFVTVWLGILDLETGILTAANAGHEYPLLKEPDGSYVLYRDRHGFVLGGEAGMKYREYEITMRPGSSLFLYTDGLPEAVDPDENMFTTDRILEVLNESPEASPRTAVMNMRKAVDDYVRDSEPFDDLTMLCMQYNGPDKKGAEE